MDAQTLLQWEAVTQQLAALGVKSYQVIRAAMLDAGVAEDDAAIEELRPKWDVLVDDIKRASGQ
jgi:hypothetical protein